MSVKVATRYVGDMDSYLVAVENRVRNASFLKKYEANKAVSSLGMPPADKDEIKRRLRVQRRNKRIAKRARRARFLKKLAKMRMVMHTVAAAAVALSCPPAAPAMALIVLRTYVETKVVEGVTNHFDKAGSAAIKDAKTAITALKAAKRAEPTALLAARMARSGGR